ncbi:hypothetical protein ABIA39_007913 [Nocardia sp. GAS34]|uniref:hypothetical protein n=1 Tax=unclassified Nocardia TaxID=2637762 RepID=UPI003D1D58FD
MVRTAVAAADPDEPDRPMSAPRPDHRPGLEIVESESVTGHLAGGNEHDGDHLLGVDADELSASARHRVAAFIHTQLAVLEDLHDAP